MRHPIIYLILFHCVLFFSGCCIFRNYTLFSEPAPALDSATVLQMNGSFGLMRLDGNINAAPVNHLGISASGGVRMPLSGRWSANTSQFSVGYFDAHDNHGFEVFGGWGRQNFHVLQDTCSFRKHPSSKRDEYVISDTFFHYNYFFLRPDIWWNTGAIKFIAALSFKGAGSGNYQFYLKKYNQFFLDTVQHDITTTQYEGPLHVFMVEPSLQFRFGWKHVRFSVEGKYSIPVAANINVSRYFSPSRFLFTTGIQFVFH